jgi:hypothetical protein
MRDALLARRQIRVILSSRARRKSERAYITPPIIFSVHFHLSRTPLSYPLLSDHSRTSDMESSAIVSAIVSDARAIAVDMARDVLTAPPSGWEFNFAGGIETETDVGYLTVRASVGDESCEDDTIRLMYITVSRYDGDELVDGVTAELSEDGGRILDVVSWFRDDPCQHLSDAVRFAFSLRR